MLGSFFSLSLRAQSDCSHAQLDLASLQSQFVYQDSLVIDFDSATLSSFQNGRFYDQFVSLDEGFYERLYKEFQFSHLQKVGTPSLSRAEYEANWHRFEEPLFCYAIKRYADNFLLVLLTIGHQAPELTLISCDAYGHYQSGMRLASRFLDEGSSEMYQSQLLQDKLFCSYITEWETHENGCGETVIDSTVTSFSISQAGCLSQLLPEYHQRRIGWK